MVDDEGDENQFFVGALVKYSFQLCGTLPRGHLEPSVRTRIVVSACGVFTNTFSESKVSI